MTGAVAAEWTKLRSVRSTAWCVVTGLLLLAGLAPAVGAGLKEFYRSQGDPSRIAAAEPVLLALPVLQFALLVVAVLAITTEFSTGSIRATLQAVPSRPRLLAAKAAAVLPLVAVAGALSCAAGVALTWPAIGDRGVFRAGDVALDLGRTTVYLVLLAALALGLGALLRSTAGALTAAFVLLGVLPGIFAVVSTPVLNRVFEWIPTTAGSTFVGGEGPYSRLTGLLVLLGWVAGVVTLATVSLVRRDP